MKKLEEKITEGVNKSVVAHYVQKFDDKIGGYASTETAAGWVRGIGDAATDEEKKAIWNELRHKYNWRWAPSDFSAVAVAKARRGESWLEKLIKKVETYGVEQYEPHLITPEGHGMYQVALTVANYDDPRYNQIVKVRNKIKALSSANDRSELIRYFNSEFSLDKAMADKSGPKFMGTGEGTAWAYYEKPE